MKKKTGFTLIEVSLSIIILSVLFTCAYKVISVARAESQKGQWIVQSSTDLLTLNRLLGLKLGNKNYPTVIERGKIHENIRINKDAEGNYLGAVGSGNIIKGITLYSYKELIDYDSVGRIKAFKVNTSCKDFEVNLKETVTPQDKEQIFLRFPVCEAEKVYGVNNIQEGQIHWQVFSLVKDKTTGTGYLYYNTYTDPYRSSTDDKEKRAFNLKGTFRESKLEKKNKKLMVRDVKEVVIEPFGKEIIKGKKGVEGKYDKRQKSIFTIKVTCENPKDKKVNLVEVISVTNDTDFERL